MVINKISSGASRLIAYQRSGTATGSCAEPGPVRRPSAYQGGDDEGRDSQRSPEPDRQYAAWWKMLHLILTRNTHGRMKFQRRRRGRM